MTTIEKLTNIYIVSTFLLFGYSFVEVYNRADNYFAATLIYMDDTLTNFLFYNLLFSIAILSYKICVWLYFQEVKENQTIKMVDKLKAKIIDFILLCYILEGQIQLSSFVCILFIFFSYIIHCMCIFRAEYLIHTPASLSLNLNYRLAILMLILCFIDYQMLKYSLDLLYSQSSTHFIFVYYTIIISMSIVEPTVKYFIDFYSKYTLCHINNIDQHLALITLCISVPKLIIQIALSIYLAVKFSIFFYLIFTIIQLISELTHTIKSYNRIKKLTDTMKNLRKIDQQQIKKHHDNTCMICFQDMITATILPCQHFFHQQCLRQWIIKNSNHFCPKCKKQFNFDNKNQQKTQLNQEELRILNQRRQKLINQKIQLQRQKRLNKMKQREIKHKLKKKLEQHSKQQKSMSQQFDQQKKQNNQSYEKYLQNQNQKHFYQDQKNEQPLIKVQRKNKPMISSSSEPTQIVSAQTPLQIMQSLKNTYVRVGSLAYAYPTQAVYRRTLRHMAVRDKYERANQKLMYDFTSRKDQQMILLADV